MLFIYRCSQGLSIHLIIIIKYRLLPALTQFTMQQTRAFFNALSNSEAADTYLMVMFPITADPVPKVRLLTVE